MALVCRAWRDAAPITSYDVMLRPLLGLSELSSRLAVITARHSSLTSLSFRCALRTGLRLCMRPRVRSVPTSSLWGPCMGAWG